MRYRGIITSLVLSLLLCAVLLANNPSPLEQPRPYGYIWDLPADLLSPQTLELTHGARIPTPQWRTAYGPVKDRATGREYWTLIYVKVN